MNRRHALIVSLLLAVSVAAGVFAVVRPTAGGATSQATRVSGAQIAARQHKLDTWEKSLHKALAARPPKLPALPKARSGSAAVAAPRTVYVRAQAPATSIAIPHGDDGGEHGGDGGGFDD